jgi:hypothetical protein
VRPLFHKLFERISHTLRLRALHCHLPPRKREVSIYSKKRFRFVLVLSWFLELLYEGEQKQKEIRPCPTGSFLGTFA